MEESQLNKVITNVLSKRVDIFPPNSTYMGFQVEADSEESIVQHRKNGFCSDPQYGRIVYLDKNGKTHKSDPIMLKIMTPPGLSVYNFISFQYINELNFYSGMVREFDKIDESFSSMFPKFYHGEMIFGSEKNEAVIILEDLKVRDFKMAEKRSFLNFDHLKLMMRKLGEFHSFSYQAKNTSPGMFYPLVNNFFETHLVYNWQYRGILTKLGRRGMEHLEKRDPKYKKFVPKIEEMLLKADDIVQKVLTEGGANPLAVLCHGDYLRNNVMFRYENNTPVDLVFVDLAMCRFASPILDLFGCLYMNSDQQMRNAHWDDLIDEYYTALKGKFPENEVPQKSALLSDLSEQAFVCYLTSTYYLPRLMCYDDNLSLTPDVDSDTGEKIQDLNSPEIPFEGMIKCFSAMGGEAATQALSDILVDLIDRGFFL